MRSVEENINVAENAGYTLLSTHTLPRNSWIDGYYDVLLLRARNLLDHPDSVVRQHAADTVKQIEVFDLSEDSYGYVFYVLQRP